MLGPWKNSVLIHYGVLSGKGLGDRNRGERPDQTYRHSKLFQVLLQPRRRPTLGGFRAMGPSQFRPFELRLYDLDLCWDRARRAHYRSRSFKLSNGEGSCEDLRQAGAGGCDA